MPPSRSNRVRPRPSFLETMHGIAPCAGAMAVACAGMLLADACASKQCDERPGGSGKIDGKVLGSGFKAVVAAYELGHVDTPGITVIWAFDQAVTCCEMQDEGWDERVKNGTLALEIGLAGTTARTYAVSTAAEPPKGKSSVAAKYKNVDGLQESLAKSGSVTIDSIHGGVVTGSFDVMFDDGQVSGSLSAVTCEQGAEP